MRVLRSLGSILTCDVRTVEEVGVVKNETTDLEVETGRKQGGMFPRISLVAMTTTFGA